MIERSSTQCSSIELRRCLRGWNRRPFAQQEAERAPRQGRTPICSLATVCRCTKRVPLARTREQKKSPTEACDLLRGRAAGGNAATLKLRHSAEGSTARDRENEPAAGVEIGTGSKGARRVPILKNCEPRVAPSTTKDSIRFVRCAKKFVSTLSALSNGRPLYI